MIVRSFTAQSFAGFWRIWNPLFGYYLLSYVYRPVERFAPRSLAIIVTFAVSGFIHDVFASVAVRNWYILFTPVFVVYGLTIIVEVGIGLRLDRLSTAARVVIFLVLLLGPLLGALLLRNYFAV